MSLFDTARKTPMKTGEVQAKDLAEAKGVRIVDVREAAELNDDVGHIDGIEHIPMGSIAGAAPSWNKDDEIVFVCRSGARSGRVAGMLAQAGFTKAMNLSGGMAAWNAAGLPVKR